MARQEGSMQFLQEIKATIRFRARHWKPVNGRLFAVWYLQQRHFAGPKQHTMVHISEKWTSQQETAQRSASS
eukprot:184510-Pelagomonas_calceolata.AAC.2